MLKFTELGETIATTIEDMERVKRGIDSALGSIYRFNIFTDVATIDDTYLLVQKRHLGSAFILDHPINSILDNPIIAGSRHYLDGTKGNWVTIAEYTGTTAP